MPDHADPSTSELPTALNAPGVRVLLAGTGAHGAESTLPTLSSVPGTVQDLGRTLVERCGLDPADLSILLDPSDPMVLGEALMRAAGQAENVLMFSYIGHGLVSAGNQLHLATAATDDDSRGLTFKALPYSAVRDALAACRARTIVVMLDCCFAGRAHGSLGSPAEDAMVAAQVHGGYLLASAARHEAAHAPVGARHTAFTGELIKLLCEGDPTGPPALTLDHIHRHLTRALADRGLPRPQRQAAGLADHMVLAKNRAYRPPPPTVARSADPAHDRAAQATSPYRGLAAFGPGDADYYFGRERLTARLVHLLVEQLPDGGPLVVTGPSGSGKSSLLYAGLLPALQKGLPGVEVSRTWPVLTFTPHARPLRELAQRMAQHERTPRNSEPREGPSTEPDDRERLADAARRLLQSQASGALVPGSRVVLIVDQFEQLFTACTDPAEQQAFIGALCRASSPGPDGSEPPMLVVLGVRSDFYAHCSAYPELVPALQHHQLVTEPMSSDELCDAIRKPAAAAGLVLEGGLAEALIRDLRAGGRAGPDHGTLPLLSHALLATWQQREGRLLTLAGYQATGGIWQAVAQTAECVYNGLAVQDRRIAKHLLLRLVRIGDGTEDTRCPASLDELTGAESVTDPAAVARVLDAFAQARLLSLDEQDAQITHEALLHAWPLLRRWIDTDRAELLIGQRLAEAAEQWEREQHDAGALYRGTRLEFAERWSESGHRHLLTPAMREFLDASLRQRRAETRARRRRARLLYGLLAGLAALLLTASGLTVDAVQQRRAADRQRDLAMSRLIAKDADEQRNNDTSLAMQLSLIAYRIAPTPEARASLLNSTTGPAATRLLGPKGIIQSVAFGPGGRTLAAAGADGSVHLWDTTGGHRPNSLGPPLTGSADTVMALAFSPDGRTLAAAGIDRVVRLWDLDGDRARPVPYARERLQAGDTIYSLDFSPDGKTLAAGSADKAIHLWNVAEPERPRAVATLKGHQGYVQSVAFSTDGTVLASGGTDDTVRLWTLADPESPKALTTLSEPSKVVYSVAFSPDGRTLAAGGAENIVRLWNVADPERPRTLGQPLTGPTSFIHSVAFSPDGRTLAAGSSDDRARAWDLATGRLVSVLPHPGAVPTVGFGGDTQTLATGASDGAVRLWKLPGAALSGPTDAVFTVAFSPDADVLVAGSRDGTLWLWNMADPRRRALFGGPLPSDDAADDFAGSLAVSPKGPLLATGGNQGSVYLWDVSAPQRPVPHASRPLPGPKASVETLAFSPDGRLLAAGGEDHMVHMWDVSDPRRPAAVSTLIGHGNYVQSVAFSPDGRFIATASVDGTVRVWDITDTRRSTEVATLKGPENYVYAVAYHPRGDVLVAGDSIGKLHLWDTSDPRRPTRVGVPLDGHNGYVFWAEFAPNGNTLASGGTDGRVRLWDLSEPAAPRTVATLTGPADGVFSVAFSPDGHTLAASGLDRTVRLWETDPEQAAAHICSVSGDPLSRDEWNQYVRDADRAYAPPCP
ncbi:caspase, EACC1-associated type [Streptomyces sp. MUM 178J]|uniref:caspase, EACC1-associated type n=1 Tax=Streptomyces sp. MUM 178J TaxID=2791991 RepID=UPI001F03DF88|nr:AAA family ATPase [Streptomyces sp. MUM 178J]WRQ79864.1 AAA family ATPase [Streptomyces sp. MUM 178J]